MSRKETSSHPATTTTTATSTATTTTTTATTETTSKQSHFNVIETLEEYNRSQTNKILCIDNDTTTLDHDVVGETTHDSDMPQLPDPANITKTMKKFPIYYEWVQTLMDYNNQLIGIIDEVHSERDTKATHDNNCSTVPLSSAAIAVDKHNLIDFDDCQYEQVQSTESISSSSVMAYEEIAVQNQKLIAENSDLKRKMQSLEQQNAGLEEAAVEARVLVFEVAERHDMIVKLKNEINEMEQQLKQKDTHIQFKDEIIKKLRLQRRSYMRCPHDLGKTKLDSIDKVVDLIRTVSRDISPDPTSKDCDCYNDFYQEKENQTDDVMCQSNETGPHYESKIEAQLAEIEMLNAELDKKEASHERISKAYAALQQQLESINSINPKTTTNDSQIKHLEESLKTHSDTIQRLEEHQSVLKSQIAESQEKQQNFQKLMDENRKLDSNGNFLIVHSSSPAATASTCSNNVSSINTNCSCQRYREFSADILSENLHTSFQENMKLSKVITLLRDENIDLRERIVDVETDYVILADSYRNFITITFQYENDLLEELAFKSFDNDEDCSPNGTTNIAESRVLNNIQEKLLRMENDFAKRMKIQEICYKKKLSDFQRNIMELNRQMQEQKRPAPDEETRRISEEENPRSTLKDLVAQVHQLQQIIREKEMLMKRSEIGFNFKNDSLIQKIARLESQIEQEKRHSSNLHTEIESCRRESMLTKESSLSRSDDLAKQVNDLKRQNEEYVDRLEKQSDELQRLNAKVKDATVINKQLNDELNEKTEQICHLHSENSRMMVEITKLVSEMKNGQENESHLSFQLASERKTTDSASKSLTKCEALLKKFTDKNELLGRENTSLADNVVDLKEQLKESQKREDILSRDLRSLTELLKETQHNLRLSTEKVQHLTIFQHKFVENKKAHDELLQQIAGKAANIKTIESNFAKLQHSYDELLADFNQLQEIKGKAENTLATANEWQNEQHRREELINKKIAMQSEHISTLLEDRNALIAKNQEMLRDMFILKQKLEDYHSALPSRFLDRATGFYLGGPILRYRSDPQINDFEDYQLRLDYGVERITKHLQRTRTFWENGIASAKHGSPIQKMPKPESVTIERDSIETSPQNETS